MGPGANPFGPVTEDKYNLLDLMLCEAAQLEQVIHCHSSRHAVLRTDHYLVLCGIRLAAELAGATHTIETGLSRFSQAGNR